MFEIQVAYEFDDFPVMDHLIYDMVGRHADFSGAGCGMRDLGWTCETRDEAEQISATLRCLDLSPSKIQKSDAAA